MIFKAIVEYEYPTEHKPPIKAEIVLHGDRVVANIKPLDQEMGRWIKYGVPRCGEQHYKCTSCGYYINFGQWGELYTKEFRYCPNCGAKMKSEVVEE